MPPMKQASQMLMAWPICSGRWNMCRIIDIVDGMIVAPATPSRARDRISISALCENAASTDTAPKAVPPDEQQAAGADPVGQPAHRDQHPGEQERVDVEDPQLLGGAGVQVAAHRGQRDVEDADVDRDQQRGEGEHGEADPVAAGRRGSLVCGGVERGGHLGSFGLGSVGVFSPTPRTGSTGYDIGAEESFDILRAWSRPKTRSGSSSTAAAGGVRTPRSRRTRSPG